MAGKRSLMRPRTNQNGCPIRSISIRQESRKRKSRIKFWFFLFFHLKKMSAQCKYKTKYELHSNSDWRECNIKSWTGNPKEQQEKIDGHVWRSQDSKCWSWRGFDAWEWSPDRQYPCDAGRMRNCASQSLDIIVHNQGMLGICWRGLLRTCYRTEVSIKDRYSFDPG